MHLRAATLDVKPKRRFVDECLHNQEPVQGIRYYQLGGRHIQSHVVLLSNGVGFKK